MGRTFALGHDVVQPAFEGALRFPDWRRRGDRQLRLRKRLVHMCLTTNPTHASAQPLLQTKKNSKTNVHPQRIPLINRPKQRLQHPKEQHSRIARLLILIRLVPSDLLYTPAQQTGVDRDYVFGRELALDGEVCTAFH